MQQRFDLRLTIIIIHFKLIVRIKHISVINQKSIDPLKKFIMNSCWSLVEMLINLEASIRNIDLTNEGHHLTKDSLSFFPKHPLINTFSSNQWSDMNSMITPKAYRFQIRLKIIDKTGNIIALIV